jgi:hypothetical protein
MQRVRQLLGSHFGLTDVTDAELAQAELAATDLAAKDLAQSDVAAYRSVA